MMNVKLSFRLLFRWEELVVSNYQCGDEGLTAHGYHKCLS